MLSLSYVPVKFKIQFEKEINLRNNPPLAFVLRSVLGYNLKSMCCISHKTGCSECQYNKTCAYAYIFETILEKDNKINPGTIRAAHPYLFRNIIIQNGISDKKNEQPAKNTCSNAEFDIVLLSNAINYLPYIYAAFVRAGNEGLCKERSNYSIIDVLIDNSSILIDKNNLDTCFNPLTWTYDEGISYTGHKKEILLQLKTPLRFKTHGKYNTDFSAQDFFMCLYRRAKTCCTLYGNYSGNKYNPSDKIIISEKKLKWKDKTHYSSRQKTAMKLGGVVGTFKIEGSFSDFDLALLDFAQKFNAGKNTNFGLGQLDYWERNL